MEKREICANCGIPDGELVGVVRRSTGERVYIHQWSCDKHLKSVLDAAREENRRLRAELAQKEMSYLGLHKKSQSLFGALKTHCHHLPWCNTQANYFIGGCNCGLEKALSHGAGKE